MPTFAAPTNRSQQSIARRVGVAWARIAEFPDYAVSSDGQVMCVFEDCCSRKVGKILKPFANNHGYLQVILCRDTKRFHLLLHRLVAQYHVYNPDGKPEVNHRDGNKENNNASNLEWVTHRENKEHAAQNGLTARAACMEAEMAPLSWV